MGQSDDAVAARRLEREMGVAGRKEDAVGAKLHSVLGDQALAARNRAELASEDGHERLGQMLGHEDRNPDAPRQSLE